MADSFHRLKEALADCYALESELGAGGMAAVYLAHDPRHNRKVAIKVMNPELAAIIGAARFLKEIENTANLQHHIGASAWTQDRAREWWRRTSWRLRWATMRPPQGAGDGGHRH